MEEMQVWKGKSTSDSEVCGWMDLGNPESRAQGLWKEACRRLLAIQPYNYKWDVSSCEWAASVLGLRGAHQEEGAI